MLSNAKINASTSHSCPLWLRKYGSARLARTRGLLARRSLGGGRAVLAHRGKTAAWAHSAAPRAAWKALACALVLAGKNLGEPFSGLGGPGRVVGRECRNAQQRKDHRQYPHGCRPDSSLSRALLLRRML